MHMSDALLSATVGGSMIAASTGALGYSLKKINKFDFDEKKIPMMGVMGAFIFAAQMVNFTIPFTGSSGHIGGGILLAAILGPFPALVTMASVLLIQALFFADGGLLALGCNIFNMGVITCFIAYPLIYKPIIKRGLTPKRIMLASVLSVIVGLQLGAFAVVIETVASGITELPFLTFLSFMQPIHLLIGLAEGVVTAAVLGYIFAIRKEILDSSLTNTRLSNVPIKKFLLTFLIVALLLGGIISIFASVHPDGLEWSIKGVTGTNMVNTSSDITAVTKNIQDKTAILPGYSFKDKVSKEAASSGISGILGGFFTLLIVSIVGITLQAIKKRHKFKQES